jgi:hypothetical protein
MLRDFGPYGIINMNVCVVIISAMVMLLRDAGYYCRVVSYKASHALQPFPDLLYTPI